MKSSDESFSKKWGRRSTLRVTYFVVICLNIQVRLTVRCDVCYDEKIN